MRLFISINFEEKVKNEIQDVINEMKKYTIQGKFVNIDHMHLTLEFLGEIPQEKVHKIKEVIDEVHFEPFTMNLTKVGCFKRREGNIYWLGIEHNEMLIKIQSKLHELLIKQGFELEDRPYKAHVTVGRKIRLQDDADVQRLSNSINNISINVDKIDLMKSEHINGKLVYSII